MNTRAGKLLAIAMRLNDRAAMLRLLAKAEPNLLSWLETVSDDLGRDADAIIRESERPAEVQQA